MTYDRPGKDLGTILVAPSEEVMWQLLGHGNYVRHGGVSISRAQYRHLQRMYGFQPVDAAVEADRKLHEEAEAKRKADFEERQAANDWRVRDKVYQTRSFDEATHKALHEAGDGRNLLRHAEADGMRMVAFIARFIEEPGDDPVKLLAELCSEAGYDVTLEGWDDEDDYDEDDATE